MTKCERVSEQAIINTRYSLCAAFPTLFGSTCVHTDLVGVLCDSVARAKHIVLPARQPASVHTHTDFNLQTHSTVATDFRLACIPQHNIYSYIFGTSVSVKFPFQKQSFNGLHRSFGQVLQYDFRIIISKRATKSANKQHSNALQLINVTNHKVIQHFNDILFLVVLRFWFWLWLDTLFEFWFRTSVEGVWFCSGSISLVLVLYVHFHFSIFKFSHL